MEVAPRYKQLTLMTLLTLFIQPALGLLLADGAPTVGRGKTFLTYRPKKSKIDPKSGSKPFL